jgi:hypothetical protein
VTDHVTDRLPALLAGRLDPEEASAIRQHLDGCADCAADLRWARDLQEDALRKGLRHPGSERLLELVDGRGEAASEAEAAHLASCEACGREREWLRSLPPSSQAEAELAAWARPRARVLPLQLSGLALAAAAALVVIFLLPRDRGTLPDPTSLARFDPLPVHLDRSASPMSAFEESRLVGLERYVEADWEGARAAMRRALDERPESDEVRLYLGSAEVLAGNHEGAAALLRPVADGLEPAFRDEALWILANLDLAAGDTASAERRLQALVEAAGRHATAARDLLADLSPAR